MLALNHLAQPFLTRPSGSGRQSYEQWHACASESPGTCPHLNPTRSTLLKYGHQMFLAFDPEVITEP